MVPYEVRFVWCFGYYFGDYVVSHGIVYGTAILGDIGDLK